MAILVNIGQRGFVLKEGLIAPGQQITVDQETAEKLSRVYPQELKLVMPDKIVVEPKALVKEEMGKVQDSEVQEPVKTTKKGRKKKEVK